MKYKQKIKFIYSTTPIFI